MTMREKETFTRLSPSVSSSTVTEASHQPMKPSTLTLEWMKVQRSHDTNTLYSHVNITVLRVWWFLSECLKIDPVSSSSHPLNLTLNFERYIIFITHSTVNVTSWCDVTWWCLFRLLSVSVKFTLKAINLQTVQHHELPDCYVFNIMVRVTRPFHHLSSVCVRQHL